MIVGADLALQLRNKSLSPPFLWSSLLSLILPSFMAEKTPFPALREETAGERGHAGAFAFAPTFFLLISVPPSHQTSTCATQTARISPTSA